MLRSDSQRWDIWVLVQLKLDTKCRKTSAFRWCFNCSLCGTFLLNINSDCFDFLKYWLASFLSMSIMSNASIIIVSFYRIELLAFFCTQTKFSTYSKPNVLSALNASIISALSIQQNNKPAFNSFSVIVNCFCDCS